MRFVFGCLVFLFCGMAQAQTLPATPGPIVAPEETELVRLVRHRNQLIAINQWYQENITASLQQIAVHQANLTYLQSVASPTMEQQMQITMLTNQINQMRWAVNYQLGLIDDRNLLIFQLNQQISDLMDAL